jgi:polyisoprenoid-binding protein YceI
MANRGRWLKWVIGAAVLVVVLAVAIPFSYIHFIEGKAPAPLGLKPGSGHPSTSGGSPAGVASTSVAGQWRTSAGSVVGYRVNEVLVGQKNLAVGRTHQVTGRLVIAGSTLTAASFTVPMASIHSDESERDAQFDGRIMDVAAYPTGTFTLTRPIALGQPPAVGSVRTYRATGNLTLHGHAKPVTFTLSAERTGTTIKVSGSIPVLFANWDIPNPSFGSFVTTQNHGVLEFLLDFTKS